MSALAQEYANDIVYHIQNVCDEVGGGASDHRDGERARGGGLSQRAGF